MYTPVGNRTQFNKGSRPDGRVWPPRLLLTLFFIICFLGVYSLLHPSILPVRQVKISGQFIRLSPTELQSIVADQVRGNFFRLELDSIRSALLSEPLVHAIQIRRVWPDTVHVMVIEQTAVAHWKDIGLLNEQGMLFPERSVPPSTELPRLYGPDGTEKTVLSRYIEVDYAVQRSGHKITFFSLNERHSLEFRLDNGVRVILGKRALRQRLERFLDQVLMVLAGRFSDAEYIDLRYPNGFAVKWER